MEAKMRGEENGIMVPEQEDTSRSLRSLKGTRVQTVTMKQKPARKEANRAQSQDAENTYPHHEPLEQQFSDDENENPTCASKENDPSLSPSPVKLAPPSSPRKNAHGKRPLSVLTTSMDIEPSFMEYEDMDTTDGMTASERNIAANTTPTRDIQERDSSPQRKSPKLSLLNRGLNNHASWPLREDNSIGLDLKIYEDDESSGSDSHRSSCSSRDGKENPSSSFSRGPFKDQDLDPVALKTQQYSERAHPLAILNSSSNTPHPYSLGSSSSLLEKPVSGTRKVSGSGLKKAKPRIGIRRL